MNETKYGKNVLCFICFVLFMIIQAGDAFAHRVTIFAWVEGDTVYTESKFSGGRKVQNAPIEVFDGQGNKLLSGKTDTKGEFLFKVPKKTDMKIVLLAGMGHRGEWIIPIEEFEGEVSNEVKISKPLDSVVTKSYKTNNSISEYGRKTTAARCLTSDDIQKAVENALDEKLKPIITKLNKSLEPNQGPSALDIFGGIGYILGLVGMGAYFHYRKLKK